MKKGLKTMNEKTMGAIPVSALERLEQSAVKLSLITFCLRHEELKAAPDAAEIHSIKSDLSRALREPSASVTCRCGGEVQLDNLTRYEFTCPCCDFEARGRTNLEDPEITVPCKCGNPVTMKWDRNKRMYHE